MGVDELWIRGSLVALGAIAWLTSCDSSGDDAADVGGSVRAFTDVVRQDAVTKFDLLLVVDNSASMEEKQRTLSESVPVLINRLIVPNCLDPMGNPTGVTVDAQGICTAGTPEFTPIRDLHVGIVTSSLGGHGGQTCSQTATPMLDDHGQLLGSRRAGLASWNEQGFLAWDPLGVSNDPPGTSDPAQLIGDFANHVGAVGTEGCSFAAPLEAWYRFLIDPEPPESVLMVDGITSKQGIDQLVLDQRDAFLRPDSLLAILMLSDRNDCSIIDEGQGWLVGLEQNAGESFHLPPATSACATAPNDPCCRSCVASETPAGCMPTADDPACASDALAPLDDALELRCFDQRRRFGFDLLYPTQRYVNGLTSIEVPNAAGQMVANPLYQPGNTSSIRSKSLVFLAGSVGVPWQDIATDDTRDDPRALRFMTAEELVTNNRWEMILGAAQNGVMPTDPLMIESIDPRSGTHPLTGQPVAPAESTDPQANAINGHEQGVAQRDDLQYACIFPLATARDCEAAGQNPEACECNSDDVERQRPLCQPPEGGATGTTQFYDKAYPGLRQLQVLKDFGANAVVTSICPKNVDAQGSAASDPNYGYNPAIGALLDRVAEGLSAACYPRELPVDKSSESPRFGQISCLVAEAVANDGSGCAPCTDIPGRANPSSALRELVIETLAQTGRCGAHTVACNSLCTCEIQQLSGAALQDCQNAVVAPSDLVGYCYVDEIAGIGNPDIVEKCDPTNKRMLRFVGDQTPRPGASTVITCQ